MHDTIDRRMREIPLKAITDASATIYEAAVRTPLVRLHLPFAAADGSPAPEIYLKLEALQPIGSFKIRGAWNAIRALTPETLAQGVWTVSAGNAAQGVAFAARRAGARCSVMVMDTAPQTKLDSIARLGATITQVPYDECWRTVEQHRSDRMQGHFVHPFDDDLFIAGNGTAALEILDDLPDVDTIIAPLGGGGLLAGVGAAIRALKPAVKIFAAEPETAAPLSTSLARGEASYFDNWTSSFVDGAGGRSVLPTMWPLLRELVDGSLVVSLDEARAAMKLTAERVHVIAEGAAACAVAAAVSGRAGGGKIVAIVSGGNIDLVRFAQLVGACPSS
ncbi:MAG TPA: pyridoxal-phosphate dependent enzyme [Vicinamibacterales bacterium]|nr:pyridoxal-phosphate dependent enzyme [Vicinamibacterales bacterium]